jgi:uncharacterized protein (DUF2252 family)
MFSWVWFLPSSIAEPNKSVERSLQIVQAIDQDTNNLLKTVNKNQKKAIKKQKFCKMASSSFPFYRATNYLFWNDFVNDQRREKFSTPQTKTWISADLHLDNFGAFKNGEGKIVFNINDFDESVIADYQYDLWRMATSIVLASSDELTKKEQAEVIDAFSESYLDTLSSYQDNDKEKTMDFTQKNTKGEIKKTVKKAKKEKQLELLNTWTEVVNNQRQFQPNNCDLELNPDAKTAIQAQMVAYGKTLSGNIAYNTKMFKVKDVAKRLNAGLGSLGTPRYYVLIEGETDDDHDDIILDVKRQSKPTPYQFLGREFQHNYNNFFLNDAQRHTVAYQALIHNPDAYLGWVELVDLNQQDGDFSGFYSVRERVAQTKSLKLEKLNKAQKDFLAVAKQWGEILATNHARSDQDFNKQYVPYSFEDQVVALSDGYHQEFRKLVRNIAFEYSAQVQVDYNSFVDTYQLHNNCSATNC